MYISDTNNVNEECAFSLMKALMLEQTGLKGTSQTTDDDLFWVEIYTVYGIWSKLQMCT